MEFLVRPESLNPGSNSDAVPDHFDPIKAALQRDRSFQPFEDHPRHLLP